MHGKDGSKSSSLSSTSEGGGLKRNKNNAAVIGASNAAVPLPKRNTTKTDNLPPPGPSSSKSANTSSTNVNEAIPITAVAPDKFSSDKNNNNNTTTTTTTTNATTTTSAVGPPGFSSPSSKPMISKPEGYVRKNKSLTWDSVTWATQLLPGNELFSSPNKTEFNDGLQDNDLYNSMKLKINSSDNNDDQDIIGASRNGSSTPIPSHRRHGSLQDTVQDMESLRVLTTTTTTTTTSYGVNDMNFSSGIAIPPSPLHNEWENALTKESSSSLPTSSKTTSTSSNAGLNSSDLNSLYSRTPNVSKSATSTPTMRRDGGGSVFYPATEPLKSTYNRSSQHSYATSLHDPDDFFRDFASNSRVGGHGSHRRSVTFHGLLSGVSLTDTDSDIVGGGTGGGVSGGSGGNITKDDLDVLDAGPTSTSAIANILDSPSFDRFASDILGASTEGSSSQQNASGQRVSPRRRKEPLPEDLLPLDPPTSVVSFDIPSSSPPIPRSSSWDPQQQQQQSSTSKYPDQIYIGQQQQQLQSAGGWPSMQQDGEVGYVPMDPYNYQGLNMQIMQHQQQLEQLQQRLRQVPNGTVPIPFPMPMMMNPADMMGTYGQLNGLDPQQLQQALLAQQQMMYHMMQTSFTQQHQQQQQQQMHTRQGRQPYGGAQSHTRSYSPINQNPNGGRRGKDKLAHNNIRSERSSSPLQAGASIRRGGGYDSPSSNQQQPMSPLLIEYKNVGTRFTTEQLVGHVAEFARDTHGSRYLQSKMESSPPREQDILIGEIMNHVVSLMCDTFGNYVVQNFLEHSRRRCELARKILGSVLTVALSTHGCRALQRMLDLVDLPTRNLILNELLVQKGNIMKVSTNMHGSHSLLKAIQILRQDAEKKVPIQPSPGEEDFPSSKELLACVESTVAESFISLSLHSTAYRLVVCVLNDCSPSRGERIEAMIHIVHENMNTLATDQHGVFILQHVAAIKERATPVFQYVTDNLLELSRHKYGSHLVEKCLSCTTSAQVDAIITQVLRPTGKNAAQVANESALKNTTINSGVLLLCTEYGNFVCQRLYDVSQGEMRTALKDHITANTQELQRLTFGRHILAHVNEGR